MYNETHGTGDCYTLPDDGPTGTAPILLPAIQPANDSCTPPWSCPSSIRLTGHRAAAPSKSFLICWGCCFRWQSRRDLVL
jgi:hypothetical protein